MVVNFLWRCQETFVGLSFIKYVPRCHTGRMKPLLLCSGVFHRWGYFPVSILMGVPLRESLFFFNSPVTCLSLFVFNVNSFLVPTAEECPFFLSRCRLLVLLVFSVHPVPDQQLSCYFQDATDQLKFCEGTFRYGFPPNWSSVWFPSVHRSWLPLGIDINPRRT
jgi:hypothetical protein